MFFNPVIYALKPYILIGVGFIGLLSKSLLGGIAGFVLIGLGFMILKMRKG